MIRHIVLFKIKDEYKDELPQLLQVRGSPRGAWRDSFCDVISALTIPVGTARMPQPSSTMNEAIVLPTGVCGTMSP